MPVLTLGKTVALVVGIVAVVALFMALAGVALPTWTTLALLAALAFGVVFA